MHPARLLLLAALAFAALGVVPVHAWAAPPGLEAFVAEVVARNPSLRAGALRTTAFRQEASAAGLWPDPSVSVMVDQVPGNEGEMPMFQYRLTQMIPWPGKLGLMEAAIERQGDAAAAQLEVRRLDLIVEARRSYLMLYANARLREINAENRALAGTIAAAALSRYATGAGGHHEAARAQVEQAALEVDALNLAAERASVVAMLNALRDRPATTDIADPAPAADAGAAQRSLAALTARAVQQRPELKVMEAMQREASTMGALARRERYPDLMASAWYNQMIGEPDSAGLMIGVTLPVFGLARQSRRASAFESRAASAAEDAAAMRAMIRGQVADAYQRVEIAARETRLLRELVLPRARQSYEASVIGYTTGTVDIIGVLDARRALQNTARAIVAATVRREVASAELARAVGGAIEEQP